MDAESMRNPSYPMLCIPHKDFKSMVCRCMAAGLSQHRGLGFRGLW